ncbi:MAG: type I restriction endonuclease subunit R [Elusimicrobia bacterium CG_4_10_14_0_8_um_filter_37_32]|nr:MAG: type I restriction endonuclease subunit R [Elusimicrobia bacterium CG_4_10_14_0_8_um_filter_37_32]
MVKLNILVLINVNEKIMFKENLTENQTRKKIIDDLLTKAGWNISNSSEVVEEFEITGAGYKKSSIAQNQPEINPSGFSDYLLLDRASEPLAIIEAKRTSRDPVSGKQQAEDYADGIKKIHNVDPLIFLTNGYEIWYWNRQRYAPVMVHGFFNKTELERIRYQNTFRKDPCTIQIKPEIIDRDYQIEALKRIFDGLKKNKRKFLLVMATGTGKTRTVMALIDVLIKAGWAEKVLFLVDREALAVQSFGDGFKQHLPNESRHYIRGGEIDTSCRLYVSTIQTMMGCFHKVSPGFFDVIISDECHRSIYNKWKDVLSYFHSIHVGLTATPSDYIDRDTFKYFECENDTPVFNYSFDEAVKNKVLVDFRPPYSAKTNFQIKGIKGNELPPSIQKKLVEEGYTLEDIDFEGTEIEKNVTNAGTNESLVREFMEVCIKDDSGVIPSKSIIFALSHNHAKRLWEIFNRLYPEYKGRLVDIIDSKMERPLKLIEKFKDENFPRVAISVDMLDTGIDIREICNLVFAKPVFSKIKFWQMIGRGTRTLEKDLSKRKPWCTEKDRFMIIDHWSNFEYFGEKPEGEAPAVQYPIPCKIFITRLKKLKIFKTNDDKECFKRVKEEVINDIKTLPENSITIKESRKNIDKALSSNVWQDLDDESFEFLEKSIAPLMKYKSDFNLFQEQFILKTEKLALSVLLNNQEDIELFEKSIIDDIKRLPMNLNAVRKKGNEIKKALSDEFWSQLTHDKCEFLKEHLTEIMKYKLIQEREIVRLDIGDDVIERKWIAFGPEGEGDYVHSYREKVENKILELAGRHPTLQKIKNNQPISEQDIFELEKTLNSPELYVTEDNFRKIYNKPYGTFTQFIKFVLGIYKFPEPEDLINESFNTYIVERNNRTPLTAEQIRFLRTVKNVFAKKKHIEYNDFFEPPFTSFGTDAAVRLFDENELKEIVGIFNSIRIQ